MEPGLCSTCRHARRIVSRRESTFWQCRRAQQDPAYPKYPRLPVLDCRGYEAGEGISREPAPSDHPER